MGYGGKLKSFSSSQKGGGNMSISIVIDWKFAGALGLTGVLVYLVSKIDPAEAKEAFNHAVDACKEIAVASKAYR